MWVRKSIKQIFTLCFLTMVLEWQLSVRACRAVKDLAERKQVFRQGGQDLIPGQDELSQREKVFTERK